MKLDGLANFPLDILHGATRGEDIVHKDEVATFHAVSVSHSEGSTQVFHSLGAIQFCLRGGVANTLEGIPHGCPSLLGEQAGEFLRLIKFALAEANVMQGNGDESVHGTRGDAWIGERFC